MVLVQPGDRKAEVTSPERPGTIAREHHDGAGTKVRDKEGGGRDLRDVGCGTLPDGVLERRPGDDDRGRARSLAVSAYVPGRIGANETAQFIEIAARCPGASAPPAAHREANRG